MKFMKEKVRTRTPNYVNALKSQYGRKKLNNIVEKLGLNPRFSNISPSRGRENYFILSGMISIERDKFIFFCDT